MSHILKNSPSLVQRIAIALIAMCLVSLVIPATGNEQPVSQLAIEPQGLLRKVTVYELKLHDLPPDMTVTIVKKGTNLPEIQVEQGRMRYSAPEGNLASFPTKVREHAERMFGATVERGPKQR